MVDEIQQSRLCPLQVVEDDDDGPALREQLEEHPHGTKRVLAGNDRLFSGADRGRDDVQKLTPVGIVLKQAAELVVGRDLLEDLDEREVSDSFTVGETAAAEHDRIRGRCDKLVDHTRLADAGRTEHGEQLARAVADGTAVHLSQLLEFALAPDEGGVEAPLECRCIGSDTEQPIGEHRLGLSLGIQRRDRLEFEGALGELPGRVAEEDVAGLGSLLEPRRDVDCVSGCERPAFVRDHLTGVDPHPHLELGAELALQLGVERRQLVAQLGGGSRCPQRIVLVDNRDPEHRHDGVADELLDGPAVAFEHLARDVEVPLHHAPQRLRVEPFAQRGRPGHVAEEDRDDLAELPHLGDSERGAAGVAEARAVPVLVSAGRAGGHAHSV